MSDSYPDELFAGCVLEREHTSVVHAEAKGYSCDECGKRFKVAQNLKYHKESHLEKRSFQCTECDHKSTRKWGLKMHRLIHNGEKPFP